MSTRKEQQAANKAAKDQIREIQKQRVRREEVLTEMLKEKERRMLVEKAKTMEAESKATSDAKYTSEKAARYLSYFNAKQDANIRERNAGIDQDNRRANAVANVNANQIQAAAADVGHDGEFDMPEGIEYTSKKKGGDRKKSAKKRKTKKRTTKRRIYKNKSNKRI